MRRKFIPPRLLIVFAMLLAACQAAVQPTRPVTTRRATFTPLIVQTIPPVPTPTLSPELALPAAEAREMTRAAPYTGTDLVKKPLHFILVQAGRCAWEPAWCPIEQGILDAAREMNVTVTLLGPDSASGQPVGTVQQMAGLIDQVVAGQPDGIALTISDPLELHAPILRAIQSGIPIIAYHAGSGPIQDDLPYLTYLGMDNLQGGCLGGQRLIQAGAKAGVCIHLAPDQADLKARCKGFLAAFAEAGLIAEELNLASQAAQAQDGLQRYAQDHTQVNAYLTTGADSAQVFYAWQQSSGQTQGAILHGTFDLNAAVVASVEDGTTLFAVDEQPYLVGYSAVMFLTLALRQNIWPVAPITPTGPGFVDLSNIAIVKQLAGIYR